VSPGSSQKAPSAVAWEGARTGVRKHPPEGVPRGAWGRVRRGVREVYRMLKYGTEYVQQGMQEYEQKVRGQMERALQRKAAALGYQLIRTPALPAEPVQAPT
jgi:hypothetical protein